MSEILVDHPMLLVEELLKFRIGDKGRLHHIRDSLKAGRSLSDSDKIFLKEMKQNLETNAIQDLENSFYHFGDNLISSNDTSSEKTEDGNTDFEIEIQKMKESISTIRYHDERIMDNLELLTTNREILYKKSTKSNNKEKVSYTQKETTSTWYSWILKIEETSFIQKFKKSFSKKS